MSKFNTIAVALVAVAAVLLVSLAYNIGGSAEETRALKMGAITRKRMSTIRERLTKCVATNKASDEGVLTKESVTAFLQETNQLLLSENTLFRQQNEEGVHVLEECSKHLRDVREELTGATESNATHLLESLEEDKVKLEKSISDANETKALDQQHMQRLVKAYRLEMKRLVKAISKQQREMRMKAYNKTKAAPALDSTSTKVTAEPPVAPAKDPVKEATPSAAPAAPVDCAQQQQNHTEFYSIMMDAGSTGSRTHVFRFTKVNGSLTLHDEVFESVRPGLSSFKEDADAAAKSLEPLMDIAVKSVPKEYAACTPVALKATAGLRLLGEERSNEILNKVTALLKKYPFTVGEGAAIVMDAKDEGPYAWLTVNFLLGNIKPQARTAAIMDMGGASTQVVFTPDDAKTLADAPKDYLYKATITGTELTAYQHSFLGLGLKEAGNTLTKAAAAAGGDFVCFPKGYAVEVNGKNVTNTEESNFTACLELAQAAFFTPKEGDEAACPHKPCPIRGVFLPDLGTTFTGPIYAFSYFYDRMESFLKEGDTYTVGTFKTVGTQVCEAESHAAKNVGTMCMDFAFLYSILRHGYGLPDDRELLIKKKINGIETAWPLGASLATIRS